MENNLNDIHSQNQKRIENYINRLQNINDNSKEEDIKVVIEDSFENQEKEYEENNREREIKKEVSLAPLFFVIMLGINLIVYNQFGDDNLLVFFLAFIISLYIFHKFFPKNAKKKLFEHFDELLNKITILFIFLFKDNNKEDKFKKYITVSSEDKDKLINEEDKTDNNKIPYNDMNSPIITL